MKPGQLVSINARGASMANCLQSSIGVVTMTRQSWGNGKYCIPIFIFDTCEERALFEDEFEIIEYNEVS